MKYSSSRCSLFAALALAAAASTSCGSSSTAGHVGNQDRGASGGSGGVSGSSLGSGSPSGGLLVGSGDSNVDLGNEEDGGGSGAGIGTSFGCPSPAQQNDFTSPILDTGVPANAASLFAAADVGSEGPCMYEPEPGSLFPNNWIRLRFRFNTVNSENLYEIKMVVPNETSPLLIYTAQTTYTLDKATWAKITSVGVNATIHVSVRSAVVTHGKLSGGPWIGTRGTLQIAPVPAQGSVVYWTTSNGTVLKGFQLGSEADPQPVLTPAQIGTGCVGCHTSTPDGLFVGLTASNDSTTGDAPGFLDIRAVDGGLARPPFASSDALALLGRKGQHAPSFSPGHWSPGDRIALSMLAVDDASAIAWTNLEAKSQTQGQDWGVVARNGDPNQAASASFSHDGQSIVYTSTTDQNSGTNTNDGLLYVVPFNGGKGGAATPLAGASDPGYLQFYPSYSHDDRFIAFNRLSNSLAYGSTPSTYNNPNSEVFVVPAAGGAATRVAANDPPTCLNAPSPGIMNSWAKWSPQVVTACGNSYYFFVFSSNRDPGALDSPQLYFAPVVVDANGKVTTYAAIYPWNQPEAEHNHTPAWDIFQIPPPPPPR